MPLLSIENYSQFRQDYCYEDRQNEFEILQTGNLKCTGIFKGIFPRAVPENYPNGVNLRKFERICQTVFAECDIELRKKSFTDIHMKNLQSVACAIVHWKMASQGGRARLKVENVLSKWNQDTHKKLLGAFRDSDISNFRISGVRIPIASAFLRFLYPESFGIIDSRVAQITQKQRITNLSIRNDGYINDTKKNILEYNEKYIPFLQSEALILNNSGAQFRDLNEQEEPIMSSFRPCDIEMALFEKSD